MAALVVVLATFFMPCSNDPNPGVLLVSLVVHRIHLQQQVFAIRFCQCAYTQCTLHHELLLGLQACLQQVCWTEQERLDLSAARLIHDESAVAHGNAATQPVFCFETALKALYFSFLVRYVSCHLLLSHGCLRATFVWHVSGL